VTVSEAGAVAPKELQTSTWEDVYGALDFILGVPKVLKKLGVCVWGCLSKFG
jgi:hypothetical protein